ncbi:MAG: hypothetical protein LBH67_01255 [Rickettsia sp.]|jgi:hypothetical protein|nr:hypothetical protein [Rickettsia sp.]
MVSVDVPTNLAVPASTFLGLLKEEIGMYNEKKESCRMSSNQMTMVSLNQL